jgi:hypothetical protein
MDSDEWKQRGTTATPQNGNGDAAVAAATKAMAEVYQSWCEAHIGVEKELVVQRWREAIRGYFPNRIRESISAEEWYQFRADGWKRQVPNPIGDRVEFAADDLPF